LHLLLLLLLRNSYKYRLRFSELGFQLYDLGCRRLRCVLGLFSVEDEFLVLPDDCVGASVRSYI
jgi:hypothetical protein